jgi:hypothetical protein
MNEIATIKSLPISKQGVIDIANAIVYDVTENGANPLDYEPILKVLESIRKAVKENHKYMDALEDECRKYEGEGKSFKYNGVKFSVQERPFYDFSVCEDEKYNELIKQKNLLEEKIKGREIFLKYLKEPVGDAELGNIIYPPAKINKTIVAVSL